MPAVTTKELPPDGASYSVRFPNSAWGNGASYSVSCANWLVRSRRSSIRCAGPRFEGRQRAPQRSCSRRREGLPSRVASGTKKPPASEAVFERIRRPRMTLRGDIGRRQSSFRALSAWTMRVLVDASTESANTSAITSIMFNLLPWTHDVDLTSWFHYRQEAERSSFVRVEGSVSRLAQTDE